MSAIRRLTVSVGLAVSVAATLTVATVGATAGFGAGAGTFTFNDTQAFADSFDPITGSDLNLSVDRTLFMFKQRPNGAIQTQVMTILSINVSTPNPDPTQPPTFSSTCLVIPDADFTVSSDLQTATLNAQNQSTPCPFFMIPVTGAVTNLGEGVVSGDSIKLPLDATATWTGNGTVAVSDDNGTFRCSTFVAIIHNHGQSEISSSVTASISGVGSFSGGQTSGIFAAVSLNSSVQSVAGLGILPAPCGGKGG
jgi:hypothetical protein